jgi:hypothetical protein
MAKVMTHMFGKINLTFDQDLNIITVYRGLGRHPSQTILPPLLTGENNG